MITKCLLYEHFQPTGISFYFFINVKRKNYVSISWSKSKRNWKVDMTKFITTRTLSVSVNMFLKNVVDWSYNYLCDSLSLIRWIHSCSVKVMAIFFCYIHFNYLEKRNYLGWKMEAKSSKSPFCVPFCKKTKPRMNDRKTDDINSMMKFYRRVRTSF